MAIKKAQNGTVAKDKTVVKKTVMKKQELAQKPTYKNLSMAVDIDERGTPSRGSIVPTKQDSVDYQSGFKKGLNRKKDLFENIVSRSGRWEGEKTTKKFVGEKNLVKKKTGGTIKKAKNGSSFAALAPPFNKATFADKIAGAKKSVSKAKKGATIKKAMMGATAKPMMKSGGSMKKCKYGCK